MRLHVTCWAILWALTAGAGLAHGDEVTELKKQIAALEARLEALESKGEPAPDGGLKVQDFSHETTGNPAVAGGITQSAGQTLSAEQMAEIMKTLEKYQKARAEHDKQLDYINKYFKIGEKK